MEAQPLPNPVSATEETASMPAILDFYFDFVSPYSYLASVVLPRLAREHRATIHYQPFGLLDLMKIVGNRPTTLECEKKGAYAIVDIHRWAKSYCVDFAPNPNWRNIDFAELGRGAIAAREEGREADYVNAIYPALYGRPRDLSQHSELVDVLERAGFDGARLLERAKSAECIASLDGNTRMAAARGAFGSPTIFVGDEMFFGNDRLDFVAGAMRAAA
jgi:2-hydroxychromene-2-carboxylate isomerase